MSDLTIEELKEKLVMIDKDIERLRSSGADLRHITVLGEYKDYITDEIKFLENEQRRKS